jgi:hypothetical protein
VAGPLGSTRPGKDAYTTREEGTWDEPSKDAIGMYRGKSLTRDEGYDKSRITVSAGAVSHGSMGQPPGGIVNLRGKSAMGKPTFGKRKRK